MNIGDALKKSDDSLKDSLSKPSTNSISNLRLSRTNNKSLSTKKYRSSIGKKQPKSIMKWYTDGYEKGRRATNVIDFTKGSTTVDPYVVDVTLS